MAESNELEYLVNAWNVGIQDHPITLNAILNPTKEFAINFFLKCFTIYRQLSFPEATELSVPENEKLEMAVGFINEMLNGKYKVGYMDLIVPNKTTAFCFKLALNFILYSQRTVPQIKAIEHEVGSQIRSTKDEIQLCKTELNQLCVSQEILSDKIKARKQELEYVNAEYNKSKQQLSDFQIEERDKKESIQQLCSLISGKQENVQKLEAAMKEKAELYSYISNWDKLLSEFNRLEEEKKRFDEGDASISEALQEKRKCLHNFESIIDSLQNLKELLEKFATNYPALKEHYDNEVKKYNEKLQQLEIEEDLTQKLIDDVNIIGYSVVKKGKDKIEELKTCLSELEKKKLACLPRNEVLKRDNDYNIKVFISTMKECESLESEMEIRYNDGVREFEEISNRISSNKKKIIAALGGNFVV